MSKDDSSTVELKVSYVDGKPTRIRYSHNTFGLMKFDVSADGVATLDDKWDRLGDGSLKDGFDRWITTGDVLRAVQQLPFVETIVVGDGDSHATATVGSEA